MKKKTDLIEKIIKKKNSLDFYNKNFKTLVVSRDREFHIFVHSFLASGLSNKKKTGVYVVSEKNNYFPLNKILSSLGLKKIVNLKK